MRIVLLLLALSVPSARASGADADPFAGLSVSTAAAQDEPRGFFSENFGFRKELMSQFSAEPGERASSRQSAGFETLKKFSSETATWAGLDFQGRLVRRDRFIPAQNDMEGMSRPGWAFEYHNAYADLYNVLNPLLSDERRGAASGHFNVRVGRFYLPFGLNIQTDTHGQLLQLSNERNFGFERDWQAGMWGGLGRGLDYNVACLAGSGTDLKERGQRGLVSGRVSLASEYASDDGLEGGFSGLGGERLAAEGVVETSRFGGDVRARRPAPGGTATWSTELTGGRDGGDDVFTQLHQLEYLRASRRWGVAAQFRRFRRAGEPADSSAIAEATWYFRNDVASSSLHWIKLNVERPTESRGRRGVVATLQYYRYW